MTPLFLLNVPKMFPRQTKSPLNRAYLYMVPTNRLAFKFYKIFKFFIKLLKVRHFFEVTVHICRKKCSQNVPTGTGLFFVHPLKYLDHVFLGSGQQMRVDIQCHSGIFMPHIFRHRDDVRSVHDGIRYKGVPQVMDPYMPYVLYLVRLL